MAKVFELGKKQFEDFKLTRFVLGSLDLINTKITRNALKLPKDVTQMLHENPLRILPQAIFLKIRIAISFREDIALDLFCNDFTGGPECLINNGSIYKSTKSQVLHFIHSPNQQQNNMIISSTQFDTVIVDLSVEIRSKASLVSSTNHTFRQFVHLILDGIKSIDTSVGASQIDIVADFYQRIFIKITFQY